MVRAIPFPYNVAVPRYFVDNVVNQRFIADIGLNRVFVAEYKGVAGINLGLLAGRVIARRAAFALKIVVLACHPLALLAGVFDKFGTVELPHNLSVPVDLHKVKLVLQAMLGVTGAGAAHKHTAGEHLVGKTVYVFPHTDFMAVHAEKQCAVVRCLNDGESAPGFFRIIYRNACGIDSRVSHDNLLGLAECAYIERLRAFRQAVQQHAMP